MEGFPNCTIYTPVPIIIHWSGHSSRLPSHSTLHYHTGTHRPSLWILMDSNTTDLPGQRQMTPKPTFGGLDWYEPCNWYPTIPQGSTIFHGQHCSENHSAVLQTHTEIEEPLHSHLQNLRVHACHIIYHPPIVYTHTHKHTTPTTNARVCAYIQ